MTIPAQNIKILNGCDKVDGNRDAGDRCMIRRFEMSYLTSVVNGINGSTYVFAIFSCRTIITSCCGSLAMLFDTARVRPIRHSSSEYCSGLRNKRKNEIDEKSKIFRLFRFFRLFRNLSSASVERNSRLKSCPPVGLTVEEIDAADRSITTLQIDGPRLSTG